MITWISKMLRLMCESSAVWMLVEESICRIPEEGRRAQEVVITLCAASLCWPGSRGLVSTIGAFRFTLLYGRSKNHFLHSFYHLVSLHRKILKRTGVFFRKCYLVILKPVGVSVSPRWAESFCSKMVLCFFFPAYSEGPLYSLDRCS